MYGWQALFMPPPPPPSQASKTAPAASQPATTPTVDTTAPAAPTTTAAAPLVQAVKSEPSEREIVVETAVAQIVLTNRGGGRVLHWRLREYRTPSGLEDLIPSNVPADQPRPFTLRVDDPAITARLNDSLYQVSGDSGGKVDATAGAASVVFEFEDVAGLRVRRELRFEPRNYVVALSVDVRSVRLRRRRRRRRRGVRRRREQQRHARGCVSHDVRASDVRRQRARRR